MGIHTSQINFATTTKQWYSWRVTKSMHDLWKECAIFLIVVYRDLNSLTAHGNYHKILAPLSATVYVIPTYALIQFP